MARMAADRKDDREVALAISIPSVMWLGRDLRHSSTLERALLARPTEPQRGARIFETKC